MQIIEVITQKQLRLFLNLGFELLKSYPNYIAPLQMNLRSTLDVKKNPLWQVAERKLFLAIDANQKAIGSIAAIYHPQYKSVPKTGFFGYFNCINDQEVCNALFAAVTDYLKYKDCEKCIGPLNPSLNYELGVLSSGFDLNPYFMMPYNPSYYITLLQKLGHVAMRFYAYKIEQGKHEERILRIKQLIVARTGAYIEAVDFKNFEKAAAELCTIYNSAFEDHFGFVPFSEGEFLFLAKSLQPIMEKRLIFKVMLDGKAVGFGLAIPNLNTIVKTFRNGKLNVWRLLKLMYYTPKIKDAKIMIAAIAKPYQHLGLGSLIYAEMAKRTITVGVTHAEISWIAADNIKMNKAVQRLDVNVTKEYDIYEIDL